MQNPRHYKFNSGKNECEKLFLFQVVEQLQNGDSFNRTVKRKNHIVAVVAWLNRFRMFHVTMDQDQLATNFAT